MRRLFLLALAVMLLVVPAAVFAQQNKLLWDLTNTFTVQDLGFTFKYPKDWVYDTSNGIRIAENDADLKAITDNDDTTEAKGFSISLNAITLDKLGLKPDAKLEDIVDSIEKIASITETESRVEVPVMTHRAITVIGTNNKGRPGIGTIWHQDEYVVLFTLGAAKLDSDVGFSWGNILSTVRPTDALELNDEPLDSPNGDFTMGYPKGWFTSKDMPGAVAELKDDLASSSAIPKGLALVIIQAKLSDMGKDVKDVQSLTEYLRTAQGFDKEIVPVEHVILGEPALTIAGPNPKGKGSYAIITAFIKNKDNVVVIGAFAPSEDRFNEFKPTYIAMLQSITLKDKAAS